MTPEQFWIIIGIILVLLMVAGLGNRKPRRHRKPRSQRRYSRRPPTARRTPRNWRGNYPDDYYEEYS